MKILILASATLFSLSASAQYYYKDIIGTRETEEMIRLYTINNVRRVLLTSYDAEKTKSDDFHVNQLHVPASRTLKTTTRSGVSDASVLTAYYNEKGQVIRTEDSTE